jgi:hypothetical protein
VPFIITKLVFRTPELMESKKSYDEIS